MYDFLDMHEGRNPQIQKYISICPTMHHLYVYISGTKWCIVGYLSNAFVKSVYCNMIGECHTFHQFAKPQDGADGVSVTLFILLSTVKPVYNDHPMGYFSASWSSSRWPRATKMSSRRQKLLARVDWYLPSSLKRSTELITGNKFYHRGGRYRQVSLYILE